MSAARLTPAAGGGRRSLPVIGWREWLSLPAMGIVAIKAKVDTGARSSALHAIDIESFRRDDAPWLRFRVQPLQRRARPAVTVETLLHDERKVRSSTGTLELRPVILTEACLGAHSWSIELTLTNRDVMGFRFLLGRQAVRGYFLVDPGRSYLLGKRKRG